MNKPFVVAPLTVLLLAGAPLAAQDTLRSAPVAVPAPDTIPPAQDVPFPGTIRIEVDARDVARGLFRVTETIPVPAGMREMILLVPEWLPGKHAPRPWINQIADIEFKADGKTVPWKRDPVDVNALRLALPAGARTVIATMVNTSPLQTSEGRVVMTPEMLNLKFDSMSFYPAGHYVRQVRVAPSVRFPEGWTAFTALDGQATRGGVTTWDATDYETLVDSPIFAGQHARSWDLGHGVQLNAVADQAKLLALKDEHLATYKRLVDESLALFGGKHFAHYEFLVALTDKLGDIGFEHLRSSENGHKPDTWVKWDDFHFERNTLPHELVHSWNGKYRTPAGLWLPDFRGPMQNHLLWVYEGQTQFWGYVLSARSGVQDKQTVLGYLASQAASYSNKPGRDWRSVEDTTFDPITNARKPQPYASLARSEDYYVEGMLVWLEADQIIREGTGGAKGLDDFARAFFGANDGDEGILTYEFTDVVAALNAVHPHDWATFLDTRFNRPAQPAPVAGIEKAGYRLVWKEEPNPYEKGLSADNGNLYLTWSLGVTLDKDGKVSAPLWDSPAFDAGLVTGSQIVAVNGEAFSKDVVKEAITAAKASKDPIELLVKRGSRYSTVSLDYHEGLRHPWIEPVSEREQPLDRLLAPRTQGAP